MSTGNTKKKTTRKKNKDLEQFEKAKSDIKKIGIVSGVILVLLLIIGMFLSTGLSYAAITRTTIPDEFDSVIATGSHVSDFTMNAINEVTIEKGFAGKYSGGSISDIFCIERSKEMNGGVHYKKGESILSTYPGIVYILDNNNFGVTASHVSGQKYDQAELNEYLTQIAIWWYIDKVNECDDDKNYDSKGKTTSVVEDDENDKYTSAENRNYRFYNNLSVLEKKGIKANGMFGSKITALVEAALKYQGGSATPTISLPDLSNLSYTVDGSNLITDAITPNGSSNGFSYTVKVSNSNVKVLNAQGVEVDGSIAGGQAFRLKVPAGALKDGKLALDIDITATYETKNAYVYNPVGSQYQKTVLGVIDRNPVTTNASISYETEVGKGKIRKVDAESGKNVKGATIVIRDVKGNQVAQFESTDKDYEITLPVGTYTATETKIPEGYSADQTSYEFKITKDNTTEVVIKNTKQIDVPDTASNTSFIYGIGAGIVLIGIALIVVALKPENEPKKRS